MHVLGWVDRHERVLIVDGFQGDDSGSEHFLPERTVTVEADGALRGFEVDDCGCVGRGMSDETGMLTDETILAAKWRRGRENRADGMRR